MGSSAANDRAILDGIADARSIPIAPELRILAIDPGSKRVGVALSDPTETIAQPLETLAAEPAETLAIRVAETAVNYHAERIIVGLPLRLPAPPRPPTAPPQPPP